MGKRNEKKKKKRGTLTGDMNHRITVWSRGEQHHWFQATGMALDGNIAMPTVMAPVHLSLPT
jgi:hypothetical protein